ncbi:DUF3710 domain-containing protein [Actinokineospora diospyrosa]|uniref:DUF3710 domain-containing protein n=1 Tax=Actinokineospora diospyrosa TaxID=103728 RepID=A0ABT1I4T2_9PSEU|nr:Protein of unknown function (DUF3710) [Actinokineospora diospyrosa]
MALFGRGRRGRDEDVEVGAITGDDEDLPVPVDAPDGPYDEADAADDDFPRLDLGSVRIPVPDGAQLQVEMDPSGSVRAVHVLTPVGQITLNAYAAPRSGGLWREVCGELAEQLRGDGASVRSHAGDWGQELSASLGEMTLRFVGVDGPRWMLRGVVAGPPELADTSAAALRELVRNTVVVRGQQPMPVRTPLQIDLPKAIAEHIASQQPAE